MQNWHSEGKHSKHRIWWTSWLVSVGYLSIVAQEILPLPSNAGIKGVRHCGYVVLAFHCSLMCAIDELAIHSSIWIASTSMWHLEIGIVRTMFDPLSVNINRGTRKMMSFLLILSSNKMCSCFLWNFLFRPDISFFERYGRPPPVKKFAYRNFCNPRSPLILMLSNYHRSVCPHWVCWL